MINHRFIPLDQNDAHGGRKMGGKLHRLEFEMHENTAMAPTLTIVVFTRLASERRYHRENLSDGRKLPYSHMNEARRRPHSVQQTIDFLPKARASFFFFFFFFEHELAHTNRRRDNCIRQKGVYVCVCVCGQMSIRP